mgnify:CR=1 FL=1
MKGLFDKLRMLLEQRMHQCSAYYLLQFCFIRACQNPFIQIFAFKNTRISFLAWIFPANILVIPQLFNSHQRFRYLFMPEVSHTFDQFSYLFFGFSNLFIRSIRIFELEKR